MNDSTQQPHADPEEDEPGELNDQWEAQAWLYIIWAVIGLRVYCKIGYSANPLSRYRQLIAGIPERPFLLDLVACLSVEQAQLFEGILHDALKSYRARGEWFTHANARHFDRTLCRKMNEILELFHTFGYEFLIERIPLKGDRPVLSKSGHVSHVVGPEENGEEET